MKNKKQNSIWYIITIIALLIRCTLAFYFFRSKISKSNKSEYQTEKISTNQQSQTINQSNEQQNSYTNNLRTEKQENADPNTTNTPESQNKENQQQTAQPKETQIATFTTKIYTKEKARQNNMQITASRLNGKIVKNGSTFSFCNTLGPSSSKNGYQEADIFDNDGNKKKGLGGGNCQISSTLYNAVLSTPGLKVVERHEHSNKVPYVKKGKDAAVAYGSYDFKFCNESGNDIKITFNVTSDNVTTTIYKME